MNCERVSRLIAVYGDLDRAERRMISEHLRDCPACRQTWQEEERLRAMVLAIPELDPPAGLERRLLALPSQRLAPSLPAGAQHLGVAALSIGLLASLIAAWGWLGQRSEPAPVVAPPAQGEALARIDRLQAVDLGGVEAAVSALPGDRAQAAASPIALEPTPRRIAAAGLVAAPAAAPEPQTAPPEPVSEPEPDRDDDRREPEARATASAPPASAPPGPGTAPPSVCAELDLALFADLADEAGGSGCASCDGRFTEADREAAAALGLALPAGLQFDFYDAAGNSFDELVLSAADIAGRPEWRTSAPLVFCGSFPVTVQINFLPEPWTACDAPGLEHQATIPEPGRYQHAFGLALRCPAANPSSPPPVPSALPSPTPLPPSPTPVPSALPEPTQGAGAEPPLNPNPEPSPSPPGAAATPGQGMAPEPTLEHDRGTPMPGPIGDRPSPSETPSPQPSPEPPPNRHTDTAPRQPPPTRAPIKPTAPMPDPPTIFGEDEGGARKG